VVRAVAAVAGVAAMVLTLQGSVRSATVVAQVVAQVAAPSLSVRVAKGDTLESIAARTGVSVEELKRLNGITKPSQLQIGQQLKLPAPKGLVQVAAGDTLEAIAARQGTTAAALQKANPAARPEQLKVGSWLRLPPRTSKPRPAGRPEVAASSAPPPPLPPKSSEAHDRAELVQRKQTGQARWRFFGNTVVDWNGWKLHPGGVRVTLVQPTAADVGPRRARATAVGVQCSSLRQTWRVAGAWETWELPEPRSVGQQIVLDLCGNVGGSAGADIPPPSPPAP
jgi:LysM repeat protein